MSLLSRLFASRPDPREALRPLWNAVVTEARRPAWYADHGVSDTVAGRFDMVCAVLAAVLVRMESSGTMTNESVLLTELFVHDMDGQLRELGVGEKVQIEFQMQDGDVPQITDIQRVAPGVPR